MFVSTLGNKLYQPTHIRQNWIMKMITFKHINFQIITNRNIAKVQLWTCCSAINLESATFYHSAPSGNHPIWQTLTNGIAYNINHQQHNYKIKKNSCIINFVLRVENTYLKSNVTSASHSTELFICVNHMCNGWPPQSLCILEIHILNANIE